ncbi:MAG: MFS transporter, partial [Erysipelotrichaceae bacterium]
MKHRTIRLSYLFELSMNLNFMQVLWVSYLFYKGLSLWEIGLVEGVFHIVTLTMEVPTGLIADRYGRKLSRILGAVLRLIYMIMLLFVNSLPLAMIAFILVALSYSLESGSDTALIYDTL